MNACNATVHQAFYTAAIVTTRYALPHEILEFEAEYGPQAAARWAAALPPGAEWVFVFHCNGRTERECLDRRLLGGPAHGGKKMSGGQSISSGTALLLFNFGDRTVYSSLRAAGAPAKGIVPEAWGGKFVSAAAPFAS